MELKERLDEDLRRAVREQNVARRSVLRLVRSEVHNEEIARQHPLDNEAILSVISRQVRSRRESIGEFRKGQREELAQREEVELEILLEYLPAQLAPNEIADLANKAITDIGAEGPGDKGKVMGRVMAQVRGKADGSTVSSIVTEILEKL